MKEPERDEAEAGWKIPELRTISSWRPPPVNRLSDNSSADVAPVSLSASPVAGRRAAYRPRTWHLVLLVVVIVTAANWDKIPTLWAETFFRTPSKSWCRLNAARTMPEAFGREVGVQWDMKDFTIEREALGQARVTIEGVVSAKETLFLEAQVEGVAGMVDKIRTLKAASERASVLETRGAATVPAPEENSLYLLKADSAPGTKAAFRFEFTAHRTGMKWIWGQVLATKIDPPSSLAGKPLQSFAAKFAVLGSQPADVQLAQFSQAIDEYAQRVDNEQASLSKKFAAEGKDSEGNFIFPQDHAMVGERFPETRLRVLSEADVMNWPDDKLRYAINEIFARHGAVFGDKDISAWFEHFAWYHPRRGTSFDEIEEGLPEVELQNAKTLGYIRTERRKHAAEQQRQLETQRRQQAAALQAQRAAEAQAQRDAAAAQIVGGLIQGVTDALQRH